MRGTTRRQRPFDVPKTGMKSCKEFDFIAHLGPRALDRAGRQFEDPPGVPENPGKAIPAETAAHPHHPPPRVEKQRVEFEPHPERMDAGARADPQPFSLVEASVAEKPPSPEEDGIRLADRIAEDEIPGPVDDLQQIARDRDRYFFLPILRDLT